MSSPCPSRIACGPGHQSVGYCERTGDHVVHWAHDVGGYWLGRRASTTFFDDPPFEDEEQVVAAAFGVPR